MLGGLVNAAVGRYAVFKETQALAASLRAELESMLALVKRRDHLENLQRTITYLTSLTRQPGPDDFYDTGGDSQNAYAVFDANCGKVGLLGDAAASVVSAYMRLKAVDGDLVFIRERHRRQPYNLEKIVSVHQDVRTFLSDTIARADTAVTNLREFESRRFGWCSKTSLQL